MHEGGSLRNTAECFGKLGLANEVTFISGIGSDEKKIFIKNSLTRVGLSIDGLCEK